MRSGIGDEVWAEVAAVELHTFDDLELSLQALGLFDGDDAVHTDLAHGLGKDAADFLVAVGGDGTDGGDLSGVLGVARQTVERIQKAATAASMPRLRSIGLAPAATILAPWV